MFSEEKGALLWKQCKLQVTQQQLDRWQHLTVTDAAVCAHGILHVQSILPKFPVKRKKRKGPGRAAEFRPVQSPSAHQ